jgi:hypothetical protein
MICPVCHGSGRVQKPFLLIFTRRARCARCLGTGEDPPRFAERPRSTPGLMRDDEPFDRFGSSTVESRERDDDAFTVGSGGRSGGGGGGASWDADAGAPVIVDPFSAGSAAVGTAAAADAVDSNAADDISSSGDSGSGTSY